MFLKKQHIAVYQTGEGGDQRFSEEIWGLGKHRHFMYTAKEIVSTPLLKNTRTLILPGCTSGEETYRQPLGDAGFRTIKDAVVNDGLHVLAICGGAYVLSETIDWYYHGTKKTVHNPHALLKGQCSGPIEPYRGGNGNLPFKIQNIHSNITSSSIFNPWPQKLDIIYWGGGDFIWDEQEHPNIQTLYYREFDQKPAIIQFTLGKGLVTLSNVHPEVSHYNVAPDGKGAHSHDFYIKNFPGIHQIKEQLEKNNKSRKNLLQNLIL